MGKSKRLWVARDRWGYVLMTREPKSLESGVWAGSGLHGRSISKDFISVFGLTLKPGEKKQIEIREVE